MSDKWEEVGDMPQQDEGEVWIAQKGDKVVGIYRGYEEIEKTNSRLHIIETDKGNVKIWGSKVLDGKLSEIEKNNEVMIEYKGKVKSKSSKFTYKDYGVWKAKK